MMTPPRGRKWIASIGVLLLLAACTSPYASPTPAPAASPTAVVDADAPALAATSTDPATALPTATPAPLPAQAEPTATSATVAPPEAAYPPPTPGEPNMPPAYPEPPDALDGVSIAILHFAPSDREVRVSGVTRLPDDVCICTWLYINDEPVSWWPGERCATLRDGHWSLAFEPPLFAELAPPGARYTLLARAPEHPEAGEARLTLQAFVPYHGHAN